MKSLYEDMPNGYQETIQKGLSAVRYFSRNMSYGTGTKEENIERLKATPHNCKTTSKMI